MNSLVKVWLPYKSKCLVEYLPLGGTVHLSSFTTQSQTATPREGERPSSQDNEY